MNPHRGEGMRQGERGMALVTVLLVLVAVVMLAVGTLALTNSSLMIAENQVSASIARAHADAGIDATIAALFESYSSSGSLPQTPPELPAVLGLDRDVDFGPAPTVNGEPWYRRLSDSQVYLRIVGRGPRNAEYLAEALVEFGGESAAGGSPFRGAIVACQAIGLSGSGRIDSFDSRLGAYDRNDPGYAAHVLTLSDTGTVQITGNSPIYGDVNSTGGVRATGSSPIYGDINANGLVDLAAGGGVYPGNVRTTGDVMFSSSAVVHGSVLANGSIEFKNWGARINGDAQAGGEIIKAANDLAVHIPYGLIRPNSNPNVPPVPTDECDPLGIDAVMAGFASMPSTGSLVPDWWPYKTWELRPEGARRYNESNGSWENTPYTGVDAEVFGRDLKVIKVSGWNLAAGQETRITGGDVVLFIDGDFIAGGNHKVYIDADSSLTIFVTGRVQLGNSFEVLELGTNNKFPKPVNSRGLPTFSIFSSYKAGNGVALSGNGKLTASVYAPFTDLNISGSGETAGAARARNINVSGGASLHYDVALGDIDIGGGGSSHSEPSVSILSRR